MVRDRDGRHPRGAPGSATLVCIALVHCWGTVWAKQILGT